MFLHFLTPRADDVLMAALRSISSSWLDSLLAHLCDADDDIVPDNLPLGGPELQRCKGAMLPRCAVQKPMLTLARRGIASATRRTRAEYAGACVAGGNFSDRFQYFTNDKDGTFGMYAR
jgi:hypothetical protein